MNIRVPGLSPKGVQHFPGIDFYENMPLATHRPTAAFFFPRPRAQRKEQSIPAVNKQVRKSESRGFRPAPVSSVTVVIL